MVAGVRASPPGDPGQARGTWTQDLGHSGCPSSKCIFFKDKNLGLRQLKMPAATQAQCCTVGPLSSGFGVLESGSGTHSHRGELGAPCEGRVKVKASSSKP